MQFSVEEIRAAYAQNMLPSGKTSAETVERLLQEIDRLEGVHTMAVSSVAKALEHSTEYLQMTRNLSSVQARCTELLEESRRDKAYANKLVSHIAMLLDERTATETPQMHPVRENSGHVSNE